MDKIDDLELKRTYEFLEKLERESENAPPFYSNEKGEIDTSDAALFVVDGHKLTETDESEFLDLLDFQSDCYQKCALQLFTHPGDPCEDGLTSHEGKELEDHKGFCAIARIAIDECNRLRKDAKLKLEKLIKLNFGFWGADYYYMTFSAIDENTGRPGIYQAVVREYRDEYVLGLFRDCSTEKALAIISITGAEEHLAAKKKFVESAKAGISVSKESIYDVEC